MNAPAVERVAVVATGVIGASWVTCFLARGLDVAATDPGPGAEAALRATIASQWAVLPAEGLPPGASPDRLRFTTSLEAAVAEAQFVREFGAHLPDLKRALLRLLVAYAPAAPIPAIRPSGIPANPFPR